MRSIYGAAARTPTRRSPDRRPRRRAEIRESRPAIPLAPCGYKSAIKHDYAAGDGARDEQAEALVDFIEFVGAADEIVEVELLVHVEIGEDGEIHVGPHRAEKAAG